MCQSRLVKFDTGAPFGALAQNLVNSYDPTHSPAEYLQGVRDLKAFLSWHGLPSQSASAAELEEVRGLRTEVRDIFQARGARRATQLMNAMLGRARIELQVAAGRSGVALEWGAGGASLVDQLRSAVALNLAFLLQQFGAERLRVCEASPCVDVFVDLSKKGARRYCGAACASRTRVAHFRARQREE